MRHKSLDEQELEDCVVCVGFRNNPKLTLDNVFLILLFDQCLLCKSLSMQGRTLAITLTGYYLELLTSDDSL